MNIRNITRTLVGIAAILAAVTVGIAGVKSNRFSLPLLHQASMVGSYELKANQRYSLEVNGSQVVITGESDRTAVSIPVKVEQSAAKYDLTTVETKEGSTAAGLRIIKAIELRGTNTRLVFE